MPAPDRVLLGHISTAHGIRGEVIVKSYCDVPEDIASYGALTDEAGTRSFDLTIRGATKRGLIARVRGVEDRNTAEQLRGTKLYIERSRLPPPAEDEIYHNDLLGLTVLDRDGGVLGKIVAVQNFGAGDLIEVTKPGTRTTEFLPFDAQFVSEVDLDAGTVTMAIDEPEAEDNGNANANTNENLPGNDPDGQAETQ
ncbi:MAG: ribosome maturation factor RimM [Pseudomonadota bacterium]